MKTNVLGSADTLAVYTSGDLSALAALYNLEAAPAFWVWRTAVSRQELYVTQNDLVIAGAQTGFWEWDTYKAQSVTEQGTWREMFMFDTLDFSRANNRAGIAKIFQGTQAALAQQAHVLAIGRKKCSRYERVFATGTGSTASPGTLVLEGPIDYQEFIGL